MHKVTCPTTKENIVLNRFSVQNIILLDIKYMAQKLLKQNSGQKPLLNITKEPDVMHVNFVSLKN